MFHHRDLGKLIYLTTLFTKNECPIKTSFVLLLILSNVVLCEVLK